MRSTFAVIAAFGATFGSSVGSLGGAPLFAAPPLVDKYAAALRNAKALSAEVVAIDAAGKPATAGETVRIDLDRPNRMRLVVSIGGRVQESVLSDGRKLRQWTETKYQVEDAPKTLAGIAPVLPKAESVYWGTAILYMPEIVTGLRGLAEAGPVETIEGHKARPFGGAVHAGKDSPRMTVWLDEATALPLKWRHETKGTKPKITTLRFSHRDAQRRPLDTFRFLPQNQQLLDPIRLDPEYPKIALGAKAPPFTLEKLDGSQVTLAELKKQRVLLLEFWAPW